MKHSTNSLSGENEDDSSNMPGAPLAARPPVAPRVQTEPSEGLKRRYLRKLKYNRLRASQGIEGAQRAVDRVENELKAGIVPLSNEDELHRLGKLIFDREPTQDDILRILRFARKRLVGRAQIQINEVPLILYELFKHDKEKFDLLAEEIRSGNFQQDPESHCHPSPLP